MSAAMTVDTVHSCVMRRCLVCGSLCVSVCTYGTPEWRLKISHATVHFSSATAPALAGAGLAGKVGCWEVLRWPQLTVARGDRWSRRRDRCGWAGSGAHSQDVNLMEPS
eukprot:COSAG02_NODE_31099_length_539_cov_0.913636_1_plen_108_part_10